MEKIKIFLAIFVTLIIESVHSKEHYADDTSLKIAVAALSVSNLLITVILFVVIYLLYKELKSKRNYELNESPKNINRREYVRQESDTISSSYRAQLTKNESVASIISENSAENGVLQAQKSVEYVPKPETTLEKTNPVVKKTKVEPIIKREQMDAIMKDILSKTKRLDTNSLSGLNKVIAENMEKDKIIDATQTEMEKSQLDQYDQLPTPVPLQDNTNNDNDELYDVIPSDKKIKMFNHIVTENGYLIPLSSVNESSGSNDYINARRSSLKKYSDVSTYSKMSDNKEDLGSSTVTESSKKESEEMKESIC